MGLWLAFGCNGVLAVLRQGGVDAVGVGRCVMVRVGSIC